MDNQVITWLKSNRNLNKMFVRWLDEIKDFRFNVTHLPGAQNSANLLTRPPSRRGLCGWARAGSFNRGSGP